MNKREHADFKVRFTAIRNFCGDIWNNLSPTLPVYTQAVANLRGKSARIVWVYSKSASIDGEAHVGDVMILTALAPLLRASHTRVVVMSNPSLQDVLRDLDDVFTVVPYTWSKQKVLAAMADVTHVCPWSDFYRRVQKAQGPVALPLPPYVSVPAAKDVVQLRRDYTLNDQPLIGVVWRTSLIGRNPARDSELAAWVPVLTLPANFISLQYGVLDGIKEELLQLKRQTGLSLPHDERICAVGNLAGYAAQIRACDAVVTIDCSTVFLAGALGTRTCTLIPQQASFRWGQSDGPCPYYPQNRLFRQTEPEAWGRPLRAVAADLAQALLANSAPPPPTKPAGAVDTVADTARLAA